MTTFFAAVLTFAVIGLVSVVVESLMELARERVILDREAQQEREIDREVQRLESRGRR